MSMTDPNILQLLQKYPQKRRIVFHSRSEADEYLCARRRENGETQC